MTEQQNQENKNFKYYVGVKFPNVSRRYFFGTDIEDIGVGTKVIVETIGGKELAICETALISINDYTSTLALAPIIRIANDNDLRWYEQNLIDAKNAAKIFDEETKKLNLDMHLIHAQYTLDKTKITFSYTADDRVDFRELLKTLAFRLKTRIDLRQIGARDKAKIVGGIGVCGLPLCCNTFLNEFDGVSINRAKNQMLAINIPKLSGHCGKLICCLKFEDDIYTDEKTLYPQINEKIFMNKKEYTVTSYNIISRKISLSTEEENTTITLEEYTQLKSPKKKSQEQNRNHQKKPRKKFNDKNK